MLAFLVVDKRDDMVSLLGEMNGVGYHHDLAKIPSTPYGLFELKTADLLDDFDNPRRRVDSGQPWQYANELAGFEPGPSLGQARILAILTGDFIAYFLGNEQDEPGGLQRSRENSLKVGADEMHTYDRVEDADLLNVIAW